MKILQEIINEFGVEKLVEMAYEYGVYDIKECEKGITREGIQAIQIAVKEKLTEYIGALASMETAKRVDGKTGFIGNYRHHSAYPGRKRSWSRMEYFIALKSKGDEYIEYYCSNTYCLDCSYAIDVSFIPVPELLGYYVMDCEFVREQTYMFLNSVLKLESHAIHFMADQISVYWKQLPEGREVKKEYRDGGCNEIDIDSLFPCQEVEEVWYKWHDWERKEYEVIKRNYDSVEAEVETLKGQIEKAGL